mmetsp:Transcript_30077/g.71574  ORF Transcript_30077/g.71574 Transcript_30077/m.71574 type:complete len:248 (+) Transcript_30077:1091-1834(+)
MAAHAAHVKHPWNTISRKEGIWQYRNKRHSSARQPGSTSVGSSQVGSLIKRATSEPTSMLRNPVASTGSRQPSSQKTLWSESQGLKKQPRAKPRCLAQKKPPNIRPRHCSQPTSATRPKVMARSEDVAKALTQQRGSRNTKLSTATKLQVMTPCSKMPRASNVLRFAVLLSARPAQNGNATARQSACDSASTAKFCSEMSISLHKENVAAGRATTSRPSTRPVANTRLRRMGGGSSELDALESKLGC